MSLFISFASVLLAPEMFTLELSSSDYDLLRISGQTLLEEAAHEIAISHLLYSVDLTMRSFLHPRQMRK